MQEDKNLKRLLKEYAFEETSSAFNDAIMQQINAGATKQVKPLLNGFVVSVLKIIFLLSAMLVIACFIFLLLPKIPFSFFEAFNNNVYRQLFSFLIIFWIILLLNTWWNSKKEKSKLHLTN